VEIVIEKISNGYFVNQKPYAQEFLKKHQLEDSNTTKIALDKEPDDEDRKAELEQQEECYQNWVTTEGFRNKVKEGHRIAGEALWLATKTRPDICNKTPSKGSAVWSEDVAIP
jgi:PAS domain-containing protein